MKKRTGFNRSVLIAATMLVCPAFAAEVTPDRLLHPDKEPQNWLMNHRTYDGQRFSPLARINRDNVKNLKFRPSATSRTKLLATPELNYQRSATVLYVFGL